MNADYIALVVAILVAIYTFYSAFSNLIKARLIEDTPTSKIRSASQGYVELSGLAHPHEGDQLHAPLTERPCLWYHYKIERYESNGKNSHWRTLESKTSRDFFILKDDTGECAINPHRADVSTDRVKSWRGHSRHPSPGVADKPSLMGALTGGNYRYTEKIIQSNDYLYALGLFQSIHAPSSEEQQKQKTKEILNHWKQDYDTLLARFDTDANGELDMQEWENARQQAAREAQVYVLEHYNDNPIHVMGDSPLRREPYIISNRDPRQLTRKYRLHAATMTALFFLSGAGAFYIAARLF